MLGGLSNSVSFREGSNVEFDGPSFPTNFGSQKVNSDLHYDAILSEQLEITFQEPITYEPHV